MTKKQRLFVEEYLVDMNATQAAIRAGYSPETAYSIGNENLKKPEIELRISKAMADRSKRVGISQERVIRELARIAFVNAADVINAEDATLKDDVSEDDSAAILSVKVKSFGADGIEREIKMVDKIKALELLGRHLGMFKDKIELSGGLEVEKSKLDHLIKQMSGDG